MLAPPGYPGKLYRGKYCYEHHAVWWQHTGAPLRDGEVVHHKNGDKRDNRFGNLELMTTADHMAEHGRERAVEPVLATCGNCGETFERAARKMRESFKLGHAQRGAVFCGRSCQVSKQQRDLRAARA